MVSESESGWAPIETAPRDGTPVDLWVQSGADGTDVGSVDFYTDGLARFNHKTRRREGRVTNMVYETRGSNRGWYSVAGLPGMAMTVAPTHWRHLPSPPEDTQP